MAPATRGKLPSKILYTEMEADSEQSSSSSEGEAEEEEEQVAEEIEAPAMAPITISLKKVCKVCKGTGHEAGFKGATYVDCPMKPCFLCKLPGHTTLNCPHRVATEHGVIPAPRRNTRTSLDYVFHRQLQPKHPSSMMKPAYLIPDQVDCGIVRFHSRRVTCLEFHPTKDHVLISGDKKGQIGIWDYGKLHEKTIYGSIHSCIVNSMKFNAGNGESVYTSSSDGTVSLTDLETGLPLLLMNLNPNILTCTTWRMLYGMEINTEKGLVLVADNLGYLYMLDGRSNTRVGQPILIHKKGTKVTGLHCNPVQPDLLLSSGNDRFARIWDVRRLEAGCSLASLAHGRVVNSAYFSPQTGTKILTTSLDNRVRIWDSIYGNLESPSREIVHSHDFNRHLTPFRAEWDPKDPFESLAVIGRYISENYNGVALHPIDFIDTSSGKLVAEVMDPDITTISPVNKLHPRDDLLASGSSRSLFIWRPKEVRGDQQHQLPQRSKEFIFGKSDKKSRGRFDGESDDDNGFNFKGKKLKGKDSKIKVHSKVKQ